MNTNMLHVIIFINSYIYVFVAGQCSGQSEIQSVSCYRMSRMILFDIDTSSVQTVQQCAQMCLLLVACKSFSYRRNGLECELYTANSTTNPFDVIPDAEWVYTDISEWPGSIAGSCEHHPCANDELCLPVGKPARCVKVIGQCGNGWVKKVNHCYKITLNESITLTDAIIACQEEYAILADIEDIAEQSGLKDLIETYEPLNAVNQDTYSSLRISGSDSGTEGSYVWVSRGSRPLSSDLTWETGQPNNYNNQDCLLLHIHNDRSGTLGDDFCSASSNVKGYICKKEMTRQRT